MKEEDYCMCMSTLVQQSMKPRFELYVCFVGSSSGHVYGKEDNHRTQFLPLQDGCRGHLAAYLQDFLESCCFQDGSRTRSRSPRYEWLILAVLSKPVALEFGSTFRDLRLLEQLSFAPAAQVRSQGP